MIAEYEAVAQKKADPWKGQQQLDKDVELRMRRTFEVKQALLKQAGLAADVGVRTLKSKPGKPYGGLKVQAVGLNFEIEL